MSRLSRRELLGGAAALATFASRGRKARASMVRLPPGPAGLPLPDRPHGAASGTAFAALVEDLDDHERYGAAVDEILSGNVPAFLRPLTPVMLDAPDDFDGASTATVYVTADYLSVGHRTDFLRVPLDLPSAGRIATRLGMALPTPQLVDMIYSSASTVLAPEPLPPCAQMRSVPYILRHQLMVEAARAGHPIMPLMAGHKKDVVLTNRLREMPDRVAIYGWHRMDGRPIQPLSLVHGKGYADYSHGIRLVSRHMLVDGVPIDLFDALADPRIAPILTREGTLPAAGELLAVT